MANQIVWFDIPVTNMDRAIKFYSAVLEEKIEAQSIGGMTFAPLHQKEGVSGCLAVSKDAKPSPDGVLIYLNADGRLDAAVAAAQSSGGKVLQPKHQIGPYGFRAVVQDTEGNRIALHSK